MQATERTRVGLAPAWPTLAGVHLVVLAVLLGAWWRGTDGAPARRSPLETQVLALEAADGQAVHEALVSQRARARALLAEDEGRTRSYLSLTAAAAGMQLARVHFAAEPVAADRVTQPVAAWLELRGAVYDLPVFLDALHRQTALVRVDGLTGVVRPGGQAELRVLLRYHRPALPDREALGDRVARNAPTAAAAEREVLLQAAELQAWRAFAGTAAARDRIASSHRQRLLQELPALLVSAGAEGGRVTWSAAADAAPPP